MRIAIAADHGGMPLRDAPAETIRAAGHELIVLGGGQLHEGGPPTGVLLQIVDDDPVDVAIPGRSYGFSQLKQAQAAGDYLALQDQGLRVARVALDRALAHGS